MKQPIIVLIAVFAVGLLGYVGMEFVIGEEQERSQTRCLNFENDQDKTIDMARIVGHIDRAACLEQEGLFDQALEEIDQAILIDENLYQLHFQRGILLSGIHRIGEAIAAYSTAINLQATAELFEARADAFRIQGDLDSALRDYKMAIGNYGVREPPDDTYFDAFQVNVYSKAIEILLKTDRISDARQLYRDAKAANPGSTRFEIFGALVERN